MTGTDGVNGRGVDGARVWETYYEMVRHLPHDFVLAYEAITSALYNDGCGGLGEVVERAGAGRLTRVSTNQTETRGGAKSGGRAGLSTRSVVVSDKAAALKSKVDRKLRAIARDVVTIMAPADRVRLGSRRCVRCKKFAEGEWSYCPWDGSRTEEVD
jgi:hypothetical protein